MGVLPVINCADLASVKARIETAKKFLPEGSFLHCDIADAAFTFHRTWNNPTEWAAMRPPFNLEIHLMVEHPELEIEAWIAAGARRFIVHIESLNDDSMAQILKTCGARNIGVALSLNPETTVDRIAASVKYFSMVQVLSVTPGLPGQNFLPFSLEKIAWLRREWPHVIIEVDGGMNFLTAHQVKDAGADFIVSESFIFQSQDPAKAYDLLKKI